VRVWALDHPAPASERSLRLVERAIGEPGPNEILVAVAVCGSAARTFTSWRGTSPPELEVSCPATRSSAMWPPGVETPGASRRVSASGSRGCARPVVCAGSVFEETRTSAPRQASPAGTLTAATASSRSSTSATPMACPRCSPTPRPPRFCVRASSDTAPFGARGFVRAVASASTASGAPLT